MSTEGTPEFSLRLERVESSRMAWAFAISVAVHLLVFGVYQTGKSLDWWQNWEWPAWMRTPRILAELFHKPPTPLELAKLQERERQQSQAPTLFVEVNPSQATLEAPKKADYYSDKNSLAANPDSTVNTDRPKINGTQTDTVKTEDVPRPNAFPLRPQSPVAKQPAPSPDQASPKPAEPSKPQLVKPDPVKPEIVKSEPVKPQEPAKPKPAYTPGDLALARPADLARKTVDQVKTENQAKPETLAKEDQPQQPEPHVRPKTVAEALAKLADHTGLVGQKMKQDGGVHRRELDSSLDTQATPFGAYDLAVVQAVERRWYDILADERYADDRTGKVTWQFHLNSDGTISQMKLIERTIDMNYALICESAIREPSPYAPWPDEMRRIIGANYREVTFTFYYH